MVGRYHPRPFLAGGALLLPLLTACFDPITRERPGMPGQAAAVAVGGAHSCTLLGSGGLRCWGAAGLVGDGTRAARLTPVQVTGLSSGVAAVQLGAAHGCALTTTGLVYCWGQGARGQLGSGGLDDVLAPVNVLPQGHQTLGLGENHSCAVNELGELVCWGANDTFQLGSLIDPNTLLPATESLVPVPVPGLPTGIRLVAGGRGHTCVVTVGGEVFCWGANEYGQLGRITPGQSAVDTPLPVTLPGEAMGITAGQFHTCALLVAGELRCWGRNPTGALGNDTGLDSATPVAVRGLASGTLQVEAGGDSACAIAGADWAFCWGANDSGQLGDGTLISRPAPVPVGGLDPVRSISVGWGFSCAVSRAGTVSCWGKNDSGQLGNGTEADSRTPQLVLDL